MQFRLSKPLHGWRQFAGEVGIIVIGVLIALFAQQLVEDRSDRGRVDSAIAALRPEVAYIDLHASESEMTAPCVLAQIEAIQSKLASGEKGTVASLFRHIVEWLRIADAASTLVGHCLAVGQRKRHAAAA